MSYVEAIKTEQEAGRTGKGRFGTCSGWLAKRRSLRFKAICRLLRVWARGEGGGGCSKATLKNAPCGLSDLERKIGFGFFE